MEIRKKMSITRTQSYKKMVQLALRAEKLTSERMSRSNFLNRKDSILYLVNHQRRVKVLNHLVILLALGLV